jgi:hypothetical protein
MKNKRNRKKEEENEMKRLKEEDEKEEGKWIAQHRTSFSNTTRTRCDTGGGGVGTDASSAICTIDGNKSRG